MSMLLVLLFSGIFVVSRENLVECGHFMTALSRFCRKRVGTFVSSLAAHAALWLKYLVEVVSSHHSSGQHRHGSFRILLSQGSMEAEVTEAIAASRAITGTKRPRKNESDVYKFIDRFSGGATCQLCEGQGIAQTWNSTSTGNFRLHLQSHHPDEYSRSDDDESNSPTRWVKSRLEEPSQMTAVDARVCDEKLVTWIVANAYPFAVVDQPEFQDFCHALCSSYKVPCQQTMRKRVLEQWQAEKAKMRSELLQELQGRRASITTDMWTSPARGGYMVVTMHFIDSKWKLRSVIIAFMRVMYPHTGTRLADHLIRAVKNVDPSLLRSVWTITADNASNNGTLVTRLNARLQRELDRHARRTAGDASLLDGVESDPTVAHEVVQLRCTAHVLQLAVKEGLAKCPFVDTSIGHFRDIVKKLTESTKNAEALERVGRDLNERIITPKLDVVTRWNSTWIMMDSIITLRRSIVELLRRIRDRHDRYTDFNIHPGDERAREIDNDEWKAVKSFYDFLTPMKEATEMLSASQYPTFGILLLVYHLVSFHAMEVIAHPPDADSGIFARCVKAKLDEYKAHVYTKEARIAAVLDPRVKENLAMIIGDIDDVKREIEDEFNEHYRDSFLLQMQSRTGPPSAKKKKGRALRDLMARSKASLAGGAAVAEMTATDSESVEPNSANAVQYNVDDTSTPSQSDGSECDNYNEVTPFSQELERWLRAGGVSEMQESSEVCEWFRDKGDAYPQLKLMARDFLAITATSVPSEIAFSAAGAALSARRARLGDDTVTAICELKSFLKFNHPGA